MEKTLPEGCDRKFYGREYVESVCEHMDDVLIRVGLERKRPRPSAATTTRSQSQHALGIRTNAYNVTASLESFIIQHVGVTSIHPTVEFHTVLRAGLQTLAPLCLGDGRIPLYPLAEEHSASEQEPEMNGILFHLLHAPEIVASALMSMADGDVTKTALDMTHCVAQRYVERLDSRLMSGTVADIAAELVLGAVELHPCFREALCNPLVPVMLDCHSNSRTGGATAETALNIPTTPMLPVGRLVVSHAHGSICVPHPTAGDETEFEVPDEVGMEMERREDG